MLFLVSHTGGEKKQQKTILIFFNIFPDFDALTTHVKFIISLLHAAKRVMHKEILWLKTPSSTPGPSQPPPSPIKTYLSLINC